MNAHPAGDRQVGIVGAGLIGTSIGMALARTSARPALLVDADPRSAETAAALGAGKAATPELLRACDHIVIAVPPGQVATELQNLQSLNLSATFSDVASVKASVLAEAETLGVDLTRFCAAHPIAGRERGGPTAAVPELFDEAVWVRTPTAETSAQADADVQWLAEQCGARSVAMSAEDHDRALAVVSHLPQLVASLLAGQLDQAGPAGPALAGRGFRDTTRLADSDAALWVQIVLANKAALLPSLTQHARRADELAAAISRGDATALAQWLALGQSARRLLPTKTLPTAVSWARVGVVLDDRPGELARLFAVAGEAGVNIEDVTIDHAAEHPVGLVALDVSHDSAMALAEAVRRAGWHATPIQG